MKNRKNILVLIGGIAIIAMVVILPTLKAKKQADEYGKVTLSESSENSSGSEDSADIPDNERTSNPVYNYAEYQALDSDIETTELRIKIPEIPYQGIQVLINNIAEQKDYSECSFVRDVSLDENDPAYNYEKSYVVVFDECKCFLVTEDVKFNQAYAIEDRSGAMAEEYLTSADSTDSPSDNESDLSSEEPESYEAQNEDTGVYEVIEAVTNESSDVSADDADENSYTVIEEN